MRHATVGQAEEREEQRRQQQGGHGERRVASEDEQGHACVEEREPHEVSAR